jgi:hypothetical protein
MTDMIAVAIVDLKAGPALDWAVAKAQGIELHIGTSTTNPLWNEDYSFGYSPSTDWAQGGPLLEQFRVRVRHETVGESEAWLASSSLELRGFCVSGETILEAACKFLAANKFGDAVSVPRALWGGK